MIKMLIMSGKANSEDRACTDCRHCQGSLSWWCVNEKAVAARGTRIPVVYHCPYWEPATYKKDVCFIARNIPGNTWLKIYLKEKRTK